LEADPFARYIIHHIFYAMTQPTLGGMTDKVSPGAQQEGTEPKAEPLTQTKPEPSQEDKKSVSGGVTFAHQDKLPKLPIPDLKDTCHKYLDALKPLSTSSWRRMGRS
jgi:hypothetical protein